MTKLYSLSETPILDVTPELKPPKPPESYKDSHLGLGFNPVTGFDAMAGVSFADADVSDEDTVATNGFIHLVEHRSELHEHLGLAASASFSVGAYAGSAKLQLSKSIDFAASSLYLLVNVRHTLRTWILRKAVLIPEACEMLKLGKHNQFLRTIGDRYCSRVVIGGELYAIVEFQTATQSIKSALSAKLSGSVGAFSGSAEVSKRLEQTTDELVYKLTIARYGSNEPIPGAAKFFDYVLHFPKEIETVGGTQLPSDAREARLYTGAFYSPELPDPQTLNPQKKAIRALADLRTEVETISGQYKRLIAHPTLFVEPSEPEAKVTEEDLADPIDDAQKKLENLKGITKELDSVAEVLLEDSIADPPPVPTPDLSSYYPLPFVLERFVPRCTVKVHYGSSNFEGNANEWIDMAGAWLKGIDVLVANNPNIVACQKELLYWPRGTGGGDWQAATMTKESGWMPSTDVWLAEHGITAIRYRLSGQFASYYTIEYQVRTTNGIEHPEAENGGTSGVAGWSSQQHPRFYVHAVRAALKFAV